MTNANAGSMTGISVLLADSKPMESQLLAGSLRHRGFQIFSCQGEVSSILEFFENGLADVAVLCCSAASSDMAALRTLHLTIPKFPKFF